MSATEQRKLLEVLMGKEALGGMLDTIKYNSPRVCRSYLCGICPHELFTNTKMDIRPCNKIHSEKLVEDYNKAKENGETGGYEEEWVRSLSETVAECDRRIHIAQRRLNKISDDATATQLTVEISDLREEIDTLMERVESLGNASQIEEALKVLKIAEELKDLRVEKQRELRAASGSEANSQQQKLRVCDVCSAYLSIFDSDKRLADHFSGKMHIGFVKIREKLQELRRQGYGNGRGGTTGKDDGWRAGRYQSERSNYSDLSYRARNRSKPHSRDPYSDKSRGKYHEDVRDKE